mmetsp:Transcript_43527/g.87768  ORF Transcript_43527/g.87768 Transcript_43527/m.87768 type:complete len:264 (+) Transcript_43527:177-968(+)
MDDFGTWWDSVRTLYCSRSASNELCVACMRLWLCPVHVSEAEAAQGCNSKASLCKDAARRLRHRGDCTAGPPHSHGASSAGQLLLLLRRALLASAPCGRSSRRGCAHRRHAVKRGHVLPVAVCAHIVTDALLAGRLDCRHVCTRDELLSPTPRYPVFYEVRGVLLHLDPDVAEAGIGQHLAHFIISRGPRNSATVALHSLQVLRDVSCAEDVRYGDAATGHEDAVHLFVDVWLVRREVDHAIGDQAVDHRIADRQVLYLTEAE